MTITRSGRRNQLSTSNGQIVSLSNPVTNRKFPLFDSFNTYVNGHSGNLPTALDFVECSSGINLGSSVTINTGSNRIEFGLTGNFGDDIGDTGNLCGSTKGVLCRCDNIYIQFPAGTPISGGGYNISKKGTKVILTLTSSPYTQYEGVWNDGEHCLKECMDDVLHAGATEIVDKDWNFDYTDVMNNQYVSTTGQPNAGNDYVTGNLGIWRVQKNNVYQVDRKRVAVTDISKDGTYKSFTLFDWKAPATNQNWTWVTEITKYNPYGFETENKDALGIFSTAMYGYDNSAQTIISNNSSYYEVGFDGFEDYKNDNYVSGNGHGHIDLTLTGANAQGGISSVNSHSGKKSYLVEDGSLSFSVSPSNSFFHPQSLSTKKYLISAWFYTPNGGIPTITFSGGVTGVSSTLGNSIEGWRKCDVVFTPTATSFTVSFGGTSLFYLDDVRIQPFQSSMKTFVYNPQTLWLVAELDNQNYATYYNYDESGGLIQVKKETVKGVSTIKTTRSNVKQ